MMGLVCVSIPKDTHALSAADSDASHYITPAWFGANDEIRTRVSWLEAKDVDLYTTFAFWGWRQASNLQPIANIGDCSAD